MSTAVNPRPFLHELTGTKVNIKLKWGQEYVGRLLSVDSYMNFLLDDTEEYVEGELTGSVGQVMIRCNNVLYVRAHQDTVNL